MNEVVLVTGSETLTGRKLIEKLLARGSRVIAPVAGKETEKNETGKEDLCVLTWNRSSWFSTKAVIREAQRLYGRLDSAWIIHPRISSSTLFSDSESSDVENVLEHSVKGFVALSRELVPVLAASSGFLGMVLPHRSGGEPDPLDALADGAFNSFSSALIRETPPGLWSCGFTGTSPDADGFSSALLSMQEERPAKLRGRWYRYSESRRPFCGSGFVDSAL